MDEQIKKFKPNRQSKVLFLLGEVLVIFIFYSVIGFKWSIGSGVISICILVCVLLISIILFRLKMSEKLRITSKEVIQNHLFHQKRIALRSVQRVRIGYKARRYKWILLIVDFMLGIFSVANGGGFSSFSDDSVRLFVKHNNGEIMLGLGLDYSQINEAAIYMIEQIRINYPESYKFIEIEERRKLEEQKQEERQAVAEFWSQ
ncbi:MAG: hypothetical protein KGO49_11955 [Gammaproteobacteria bacterium]|nr:hypothetical protein [Gammaproteobacteria bacterium]